jgi:prepilin-type N-terminal cleavage/methylation domain-containing protein
VVSGTRQRGLSLVETLCAMVLLGMAASVAAIGTQSRSAAIVRSGQETAALAAASSRLEELRAGKLRLEPGTREFALDPLVAGWLPAATGRQILRQGAPGLLSARVEVAWGSGRWVALETLIYSGGRK